MNETVTTTNEHDFHMNVPVVMYKGVKVLTSKQMAEAYETEAKLISQGFNKNKDMFKEGKHYYVLSGETLKDFRDDSNLQSVQNGLQISNRTRTLYLWTEKGALLMAKIIETKKAWEVCEYLVDFYFSEQSAPSPAPEPDELPQNPHRTSNTPVPRNVSWYQRNSRRMGAICEKAQISRKTLYHHILVRLGEEYDIAAANRIYTQENGYPPKYAIDIVSYFPELAALADEYLDVIEFM